jgi:hypothetical protein
VFGLLLKREGFNWALLIAALLKGLLDEKVLRTAGMLVCLDCF